MHTNMFAGISPSYMNQQHAPPIHNPPFPPEYVMSTKTDKAKKSPSVSSVKPSPKPASPKTSTAVGIPPKATPRKVIPAKTPEPSPDIPIKVLQ